MNKKDKIIGRKLEMKEKIPEERRNKKKRE